MACYRECVVDDYARFTRTGEWIPAEDVLVFTAVIRSENKTAKLELV